MIRLDPVPELYKTTAITLPPLIMGVVLIKRDCYLDSFLDKYSEHKQLHHRCLPIHLKEHLTHAMEYKVILK